MDKNKKILIDLLASSIKCMPYNGNYYSNSNLPYIINDAIKHNVSTLIYKALIENCERFHINKDILERLRLQALLETAAQEQGYTELSKILNMFTRSGIQTIVLKGIVLRELYPQNLLRTMSDYDLLIKPCDIDKAGKILRDYGYVYVSDSEKEVIYAHELFPHIELHRKLVLSGLPISSDSFENDIWKRAVPFTVNNTQVLSLCPQDNLCHMILHMASHLITSGFGLRQLCDFVLFVEAYKDKFDWKEFLETTSLLHIYTFTIALFHICNLLFSLEIESVSIKSIEFDIVQSMLDNIFEGGVYGKSTIERITANRLFHVSGTNDTNDKASRLHEIKAMIFPKANRLTVRYRYAKKNRFLLPIAWVHRIIFNLTRRDIDIRAKSIIFTSELPSEINRQRIVLLKKLDIIK